MRDSEILSDAVENVLVTHAQHLAAQQDARMVEIRRRHSAPPGGIAIGACDDEAARHWSLPRRRQSTETPSVAAGAILNP